MNRSCLSLLVLACLLGACKQRGSSHEGEGAHSHGQEQGHEHGGSASAEPERPGLSVTVYQSGLELFMEYPALVVGQPSPLVAHFTDARQPGGLPGGDEGPGHRDAAPRGRHGGALRGGQAAARRHLQAGGDAHAGGRGHAHAGAGGRAGRRARWRRARCTVYPTMEAAIAAAPPEEGGEATVPFLKEQQWKTRYATAPAEVRVLQGGVARQR